MKSIRGGISELRTRLRLIAVACIAVSVSACVDPGIRESAQATYSTDYLEGRDYETTEAFEVIQCSFSQIPSSFPRLDILPQTKLATNSVLCSAIHDGSIKLLKPLPAHSTLRYEGVVIAGGIEGYEDAIIFVVEGGGALNGQRVNGSAISRRDLSKNTLKIDTGYLISR